MLKKLKEIILKRNQVLSDMEEDFKENVIETNKREINRRKKSNLIEDAAMNNKVSLEIIEERQNKKTPSNKVFLKIDNNNKKWSFEDEKNSNYYISKGDGKIYNKKGKLTNYIYTDRDGLGKITTNDVIPFIKTEQLKKV